MSLHPDLLEGLKSLSSKDRKELLKSQKILSKLDSSHETELTEAIETSIKEEPTARRPTRGRRSRPRTITEYKVSFRPSTEILLQLLEPADRQYIQQLVDQLRTQGPWAVAAEPFNKDRYLTRVGEGFCMVFTLTDDHITIEDLCSHSRLYDLYELA